MLLNFGPPCNEMLTKLVDLKYIRYEIVNCQIQLSIWYLHSQSYRLFFMKNTLSICLLPLLHAGDLYNLTLQVAVFLSSSRQSSNENSVFLPKSDAPKPTICLFFILFVSMVKYGQVWMYARFVLLGSTTLEDGTLIFISIFGNLILVFASSLSFQQKEKDCERKTCQIL